MDLMLRRRMMMKKTGKPFAECTPQEIQQIVRSGKAPEIWNIGDRHNVTLNGTVGAQTFTNDSNWDCFIIGFNHNAAIEGNNTLHLQFAKKTDDGKDIAFVDDNYLSSGSTPAYRMNTTNTNAGGWKDSYMRHTICEQFYNALPVEWQNIITPCTKYTNNVGYRPTAATVTATEDNIFLLSAPEVIRPAPDSCYPEESNKTTQYAYYANNNVNAQRIKYKSSAPDTACWWWLRSPNTNTAGSFCGVNTSGSMGISDANYSLGFAPACMIS